MTRQEQEEIYHDWLAQHKPLVFKILKAYSRNNADENDLFQEIVIQIWKSIPSFKKQSSIHTWIYRISLNTAMKWSSRKGSKEVLDGNEYTKVVQPQHQSNDKLDWLYQEIQQLDKIEKSLTLLLLDGFSYQEMSDILGISTSNVGVKINRIKKHLKERSKLVYV